LKEAYFIEIFDGIPHVRGRDNAGEPSDPNEGAGAENLEAARDRFDEA
jgi:hypothetical protein